MVSLCTIIWLADGEAEGWYHRDSGYQSSGSRRLGALCSWSLSSQHLPFVGRLLHLQNNSGNLHPILLSRYFVCVLVTQLCPTLCNPMDCSPPGSSVHGIFQARILEWVAIFFSRGSSWPKDWTWVSCTAGRFFAIWATRAAKAEDGGRGEACPSPNPGRPLGVLLGYKFCSSLPFFGTPVNYKLALAIYLSIWYASTGQSGNPGGEHLCN